MNPLAHLRRRALPLHAWLLAGLLLAAQGLGLSHGVAHAQSGAGVGAGPIANTGAIAHAHALDHGHADEHDASSAWDHGHEAGSADCRLIDQLAHADGVPGLWAQPLALQVSQVAPAEVGRPAPRPTPTAAYCARAPPR